MEKKIKKHLKNQTPESVNFLVKYSYLLIIIIPFIVFTPSIRNGFVYFDDDILILENQSKIANPDNFLRIFRTDAFFNNSSPYYRPLLNISFMIDAQLGGKTPAYYHFTNILLHILTAFSLLWLLQLMGLSYNKSLVGSLVFSVHPIMANAVFWIPARNDLLVTFFSLLFFISIIKFLKERKAMAFISTLMLFFLALFSKESAIILPILVLLYCYQTKQLYPDKHKIILFFAILAIIVGWYLLRIYSIDMRNDDQRGFAILLKTLPFPFEIIAKFFLPFNYSATPVFSSMFTGLGILLALIILILIIRIAKINTALIAFGAIWFIFFCMPNMYVRLVSASDSYDYLIHRAYLPVVGLLIVLLAILPEPWVEFKRKFNLAVFSLLIIMLSALSFVGGKKYLNPVAFWSTAIEYNPDKAWFHYFLGRYYFKQGDYIMFEKYQREALALKVYPRFLYNMGILFFLEKKQYDTAFSYFNRARSMGFNDPEANANYVKLCVESARQLFEQGKYKKAADRCQLAVDIEPTNSIAIYNMGLYLVYSGDAKRAASLWRRSLLLDPEMKEAYRSLYYYYLNNTSRNDSVNYFAREFRKRGGVI